ncbi:MAG: discoidin domain-containing protein [Bacilli bacterium]
MFSTHWRKRFIVYTLLVLFFLQMVLMTPPLATAQSFPIPPIWRGIVGSSFTQAEQTSIQQMNVNNPYPMVERVYYSWNTTVGGNWNDSEVTTYANLGYKIMVVLRYVPPTGDVGNMTAWVSWVKQAVQHYAAMTNVNWIQITNEANANLTSDSDGYYADAQQALIQGVIAAHQVKVQNNLNVGIGFNYYYGMGTSSDQSFWTSLGANGGSAFVQALDWVGIDAYPGTYTTEPNGAYAAMHDALIYMRNTCLPEANIGNTVPLYVTETGFSVLGKSESTQADHMDAFWNAVWDLHSTVNVQMFIWFNQVDRSYWSLNPGDHMGFTDTNYVPRIAWYDYQNLLGIPELENNLALNTPTTASSQQSGNNANMATDGSSATRWAASSGTDPQWLEVNLGSAQTINDVQILWQWRDVQYNYVLQTSLDGTNWTTIVDNSNNQDLWMLQNDAFAPTSAQYVRIVVSSGYQGWVSISEFRVY